MSPIHLIVFLLFFHMMSSSCSSTHLLLPLTHTLAHSFNLLHTPTHHLLKSISTRSASRFRHTRPNQNKQQQLSLPLSSGSDYTISLTLGPTTSVDLFMDTGSDLVWFPCSPFRCILCEGKTKPSSPPPLPPPPNSTRVSCMDPACSAAHSPTPTSNLCAMASCPLEDIEMSSCSTKLHHCPPIYYAYGDGSLVAQLRQGPLSLSSVKFSNFTFACSHTALAEPVGVAGFGRGALSLPNQLSSLSPSLGNRFSYCLISHSFQETRLIKPSPLILGRSTTTSETATTAPFTYTPLLHNPKYPYFYSVGLTAITVGRKNIIAHENLGSVDKNGNGGLVVDSGTTFTMLPSRLYSELTTEFATVMKKAGFVQAKEVEAETGLKPCYYYNSRNDSWKVPSMKLHFNGNASVELPKRNYFMGFEREVGKKVGCLMVMDGGDASAEEGGGGPMGTLGNFQQQGFEVVYDLEQGRVGFARRKCEGLWDELTRG